jgi:pimeloyl-ACP methyl ester carboxylesterase
VLASALAALVPGGATEPLAIHSVSTARVTADTAVWGIPGLPSRVPVVTRGIRDQRFAGYPNLLRIDRLETDTGKFKSISYLLVPRRSNGRLLIFHGGHGAGFEHYTTVLRFFLRRGFTVLGMSMPLVGMNAPPGQPSVQSHDSMKGLRHPLQYFLTPVAAAMNYLTGFGWKTISMVGLSGGGWTTTLYGALDPRIDGVYPVAGSMPLSLLPPSAWGDFEQWYPPLVHKVDFLELYALDATSRRTLQIYNLRDPCCFQGTIYRGHPWEAAVQRQVGRLGSGIFRVWIEVRNRRHSISEASLAMIDRDIALTDGPSVSRRTAPAYLVRKPVSDFR